MLQQTQVSTVIPYFLRWMRRFPDVAALAAASEDEVLKLWEGLGYYRRARNLHQAARELIRTSGGRFPRDPVAVRALPGVGRYTAGAICSIAFGQPTPILDGNVIRVLTRWAGIDDPVKEATTERRLWSLAESLVLAADEHRLPGPVRGGEGTEGRKALPREPIGRRLVRRNPCGAFNQALMELGRRVCLVRQPRCQACPWKETCHSFGDGATARRPNLGKRPPTHQRYVAAIVLEKGGRYWVRQRPAGGINGGLWEFPNRPMAAAECLPDELARFWPAADQDSIQRLAVIRHSITNHRITLTAWRARLRKGVRRNALGGRWLTIEGMGDLAFASAHRRLLERLRG